ncbi:MAG TPA: transcription termination factor Rho [Candidatus Akkermansia intestinigallinarum]|uniref:Transcription termination factor Rho n=1 Tax=Candidatus Akkermansia intestinigallinarum TaxID=2838431 RepID=A0A9D1VC83_9BACT|nr:transcription termination factor Rho [Candidatus Akkermansia intestinigallinarum]
MSASDSPSTEQQDALRPTRRRSRRHAPNGERQLAALGRREQQSNRQQQKVRQENVTRFAARKNRGSWNNQRKAAEPAAGQKAYVPVGEPQPITGLLEITQKGFGFIRVPENNWAPSDDAIYVSPEMIRKYALRPFVQLKGMAQRYERGHQLLSISEVNGQSPEEAAAAPHFEDLKAVNPTHRLAFETERNRFTTRTLDLVAPVARGQRGLIVAPPRTGKTTLLMHIAEGALENYGDDLHLMILLVDERPEEVTEFKRALPGAEIYASSNDSGVREHCRMAELCIERAKRLVESGRHVLILMDSITRLARAYNNAERGSGRTMSGGIDARALEMPRRLFAAARNTRNAGSLTILATALIETNSRMDSLIFQEFKGTGNMELVLNRRIAELYIYPAVDILKSGTRREELILPELMLEKIRLIRRGLANHKPEDAMERLLFFMRQSRNNAQMLLGLKVRG